METSSRPVPEMAAQLVIEKHFPNCQAALLAGSVVRGEATSTSDLDIVVFDKELRSSPIASHLLILAGILNVLFITLRLIKNFLRAIANERNLVCLKWCQKGLSLGMPIF